MVSFMKTILITGGTGFIGDLLTPKLVSLGFEVTCYTRCIDRAKKRHQMVVRDEVVKKIKYIEKFNEIKDSPDVVINFAGIGIGDWPWTKNRKKKLRDSRILFTTNLVRHLCELATQPSLVISGSAVGYYDKKITSGCNENAIAGKGFASELCVDWEHATSPLHKAGIPIYILRTAVVLGNGSFMARISRPTRLGLGPIFGDGSQMFSWIHIEDFVQIIIWIIMEKPIPGIYNATSPNPLRWIDFVDQLSKEFGNSAWLKIPKFPLQLVLGEMVDLFFLSNNVIPEKALKHGFSFRFPTIRQALKNLDL